MKTIINFIKGIKVSKNAIIILAIAFVIYSIHSHYQHKVVNVAKAELFEETKLANEYKNSMDWVYTSKKAWDIARKNEEETKSIYEKSVWYSRCIKDNNIKKLDNVPLNDCTKNLEKFAKYNLKK